MVRCLTITATVGLLLFDFAFHVRKAHPPTLREAATWSGIYVGLALLFGVGVLVFGGTRARRRSTSPATRSCCSCQHLARVR